MQRIIKGLYRKSSSSIVSSLFNIRNYHATTMLKTDQTQTPTITNNETKPISEKIETPDIIIDDFMKCEIVVGQISNAQFVKKSKKLICFKVDVGEENPRQILSGIRLHYPSIANTENVDQLNSLFIGQQVLVVKNLAPKTMAGLQSHGMIMFATREKPVEADESFATITPVMPKEREGTKPGTRVY